MLMNPVCVIISSHGSPCHPPKEKKSEERLLLATYPSNHKISF
eukprot:gene26208-biopygen14910